MFKLIDKIKELWDDLNFWIDVSIANKHLRYITKGFSVSVVIIIFLIVVDIFRSLFRYITVAILLIFILYMFGWLVEQTKEIRKKNIREKNDKPQHKQQDKEAHQGNKR